MKIINDVTFKSWIIVDNMQISEFEVNKTNITSDRLNWNKSQEVTYLKVIITQKVIIIEQLREYNNLLRNQIEIKILFTN